MMQCKNCRRHWSDEEIDGLKHCPTPGCVQIDEQLTEKYGRLILVQSEFERTTHSSKEVQNGH